MMTIFEHPYSLEVFIALLFFLGFFLGYVVGRKVRGRELIILIIIFMWLPIVGIAFIFEKDIPGHFDTAAWMVVIFYLGLATEKGAEVLSFIKSYKGK